MKLNVKKCEICGKEFTSYARNAKYCNKSCYKVSVFNKAKGVKLTSLKEVEEYRDANGIRGAIKFKPIMQFRIDGTYVTTVVNGEMRALMGDENGKFSSKKMGECARGEILSYRGYIWIYEEDFTEELLERRVMRIKHRHDYCKKSIVALALDGEYVKRYESIAEGCRKEFIHKNNLGTHLKRKPTHLTCGGYIWMYEKDYKGA